MTTKTPELSPVMQTKFGKDGNCFDACLATLLGLSLGSIDYFRGEDTWYADLQHWLAPQGLAYVEIELRDPSPLYRFPAPVMAIAGGPSPRGVEGGHAVIVELKGWEKRVIHDPHPSNDGLLKINSVGFLVAQKGMVAK